MTEARAEYAFPVSSIDGYTQSGMTLRDYFAAKAMAALISKSELELVSMEKNSTPQVREIVRGAYDYADAMLAERIK